MLREQDALDDRKALCITMQSQSAASKSMRHHVAAKIKSRLLEEKDRDVQGILDVQQRCMNIKKSLGYMQAARREISEQKRKAQEIFVAPEEKPQGLLAAGPDLTCGLFRQSRLRNTLIHEMEDAQGHKFQ
jgi:hypothetical protein